ncbi:MAG: PAS domain-containing protein, partial [Planctomycetes bacterium]|nr:PAS domain-containing protein [Planctomycetota bacterium]
MSPRRTNAAELAKLLDSATRPVYVLDEELTIMFVNRACREWLGTSAEGLVGQRCAYHSEPKSPGPVAAGLCPPPRILSGETVEATVCRVAEGEKFAERMARFLPLGGDKDELIAIVAVLDAEDRTPTAGGRDSGADSSEAGAIALHEHIRRFRNETAARYRADRLIGSGPAMRLARRQVELAAGGRS